MTPLPAGRPTSGIRFHLFGQASEDYGPHQDRHTARVELEVWGQDGGSGSVDLTPGAAATLAVFLDEYFATHMYVTVDQLLEEGGAGQPSPNAVQARREAILDAIGRGAFHDKWKTEQDVVQALSRLIRQLREDDYVYRQLCIERDPSRAPLYRLRTEQFGKFFPYMEVTTTTIMLPPVSEPAWPFKVAPYPEFVGPDSAL